MKENAKKKSILRAINEYKKEDKSVEKEHGNKLVDKNNER